MNEISEYSAKLDENSKIPNHMPPIYSSDGTFSEGFHYDVSQQAISARSKSDLDTEFPNEFFHLSNVRRRRRQNSEEGRLLSQSAFNRITETLGALNKVSIAENCSNYDRLILQIKPINSNIHRWEVSF